MGNIDYEAAGQFLYKTIKYHSLHFDPYTLLPEKERTMLKVQIDSLKALKINNPNLIWEKGVKDGKIPRKVHEKLMKFEESALAVINLNPNPDIVDKWFQDDIEKSKQDKDLSFDEKDFVVQHSTIMRYALKAYLEMNVPVKNQRNGKVTASCTIQMISCYWGNVSTYSGIGSFIGGGAGGIGGAVVGLFISFDSCTCEESCSYPKFISTPDICYNQYSGLDILTGGFAQATNSLFWEFANDQGIVFLTRSSTNNVIHIYDSDLQGNQSFYVRVTAYCNGGGYTTQYIRIDLNNLGKPSFFISGNSNPTVNSQQFYTIAGRNLNTVTWGVGSIGQILTQNPSGINVKWNSTGYAYLYANAQSNCGSVNSGLNVVVRN